jgi:hypothetical protein
VALSAIKAAEAATRAFAYKNSAASASFQIAAYEACGAYNQSTKTGREAAAAVNAAVLREAHQNAQHAAAKAWFATAEAVDYSEGLLAVASGPEQPPSGNGPDGLLPPLEVKTFLILEPRATLADKAATIKEAAKAAACLANAARLVSDEVNAALAAADRAFEAAPTSDKAGAEKAGAAAAVLGKAFQIAVDAALATEAARRAA